jgi:hypothetical protein
MYITRIVTVHEPDVRRLPAELRSALTKQDIAAIRNGSEYFERLALQAEPKWLSRLLRKLAQEPCELQFYAADDSPYRPYFHFPLMGSATISLPRRGRLRSDLPDELRQIYGVIGAFRENGFGFAGGLHPADTLCPVSETGLWVEPGSAIDPDSAIPFLETLSGSQLCYLPDGRGAWLAACQFRPVRKLATEIAKYFEDLLRGSRV